MTAPIGFSPVEFNTSSVINGNATVRFAAKSYPRKLTGVSIEFSENVRCDVYVGGIAAANRVSGTDKGDVNDATFLHPEHVPGGSPVLVVWQSATGVGNARANFESSQLGF
jgi:hypothetical protein